MAMYSVGVVRTLVGSVRVEARDAEQALEKVRQVAGRPGCSSGRSRLFTTKDEKWVVDEDDVWEEVS